MSAVIRLRGCGQVRCRCSAAYHLAFGRANAAARMLGKLHEWRRPLNGSRSSLAALDDRMLADIGVTRAEAEFLINKPFWRE